MLKNENIANDVNYIMNVWNNENINCARGGNNLLNNIYNVIKNNNNLKNIFNNIKNGDIQLFNKSNHEVIKHILCKKYK